MQCRRAIYSSVPCRICMCFPHKRRDSQKKSRNIKVQTLMELEFSRQISEEYSNIKLHQNPSRGSRVVPCRQTDRRTDMTKFVVAFRNFANTSEIGNSISASVMEFIIGSQRCKLLWSLYVPHSGHYMCRTAVTICTAQWSLFVPHSGHYTYRTAVTICTSQRSLYVPHSGHYLYRTVVTIRTAQRSLYVPHSCHSMCRTAVTICTVQWSLMYRTVVTICTTSLTLNNSTFCAHSVFMCFVWI